MALHLQLQTKQPSLMSLKTPFDFGLILRGLLVGKDFLVRHGGQGGKLAQYCPSHLIKAFVFCGTVGFKK